MSSAMHGNTVVGLALWTLRVAVTLVAILFLEQAVTGGNYLVGSEGAMAVHEPGAITIHVLAGIQCLAAGSLWLITKGPWWPTLLSVAVFGFSFLQASLGHGDTLHWHVPLAVTLLIAVMLVFSWAWSSGQTKLTTKLK